MLWMHLAAVSWIEIEASVQIHTMQFNIAYLTAHDNALLVHCNGPSLWLIDTLQ